MSEPMVHMQVPRSLRQKVELLILRRRSFLAKKARTQRIADACRAGEPYPSIARREGVAVPYVYQVAYRKGLREKTERQPWQGRGLQAEAFR